MNSTRSGSGKGKYQLRLRDTHTQVNFRLGWKVELCAEQDEAYEVINLNESYVALNFTRKLLTYLRGVPQHMAIYPSSHFQYIENRVDYTEQRMAIELANFACIVDNARPSLLFSVSQNALFLAGKALKQSLYAAGVDSFGDNALYTQCEVREVETEMKNTSCGPSRSSRDLLTHHRSLIKMAPQYDHL